MMQPNIIQDQALDSTAQEFSLNVVRGSVQKWVKSRQKRN